SWPPVATTRADPSNTVTGSKRAVNPAGQTTGSRSPRSVWIHTHPPAEADPWTVPWSAARCEGSPGCHADVGSATAPALAYAADGSDRISEAPATSTTRAVRISLEHTKGISRSLAVDRALGLPWPEPYPTPKRVHNGCGDICGEASMGDRSWVGFAIC